MKALIALAILAGWFLGALLGYWWGRVMLPAMGLTAPEYWTWFWAALPLMISGALGAGVKEALK